MAVSKDKTPATAKDDEVTGTAVVEAAATKLPAEFIDDFAADGQEYSETMGKDDMSIPFIQILQQLSPQCTKGKPEFIKGAEPSEFYNTVTGERWKSRDDDDNPIFGLKVMPIAYKRSFIEWIPRNQGGGIVEEYDVPTGLSIITARNENNQDIIQAGSPVGKPGNQLNDTHTHFVFIIEADGSYSPAVLTMSSTQIKPSKDWNAMIDKQRLPDGRKVARFYTTWNVTTTQRTNDQGSWYVFKFEKAGDVQADGLLAMYKDAKAFAAGIAAGEHKVDHSKVEGEVNPSTANTAGASGDTDEEVPF